MILLVCTDHDRLIEEARRAARAKPETFGRACRAFRDRAPRLGVGEDLFIAAHGVFEGEDGGPAIGDQACALAVNAEELGRGLAPVLPRGYRGSVYVSAGESADLAHGAFSFAEVLKAELAARCGAARVFGRKDPVGPGIPEPTAPGWEEAT